MCFLLKKIDFNERDGGSFHCNGTNSRFSYKNNLSTDANVNLTVVILATNEEMNFLTNEELELLHPKPQKSADVKVESSICVKVNKQTEGKWR